MLRTFSQCLRDHRRTIVLEQHLGTEEGKEGKPGGQVGRGALVGLCSLSTLRQPG